MLFFRSCVMISKLIQLYYNRTNWNTKIIFILIFRGSSLKCRLKIIKNNVINGQIPKKQLGFSQRNYHFRVPTMATPLSRTFKSLKPHSNSLLPVSKPANSSQIPPNILPQVQSSKKPSSSASTSSPKNPWTVYLILSTNPPIKTYVGVTNNFSRRYYILVFRIKFGYNQDVWSNTSGFECIICFTLWQFDCNLFLPQFLLYLCAFSPFECVCVCVYVYVDRYRGSKCVH